MNEYVTQPSKYLKNNCYKNISLMMLRLDYTTPTISSILTQLTLILNYSEFSCTSIYTLEK